VSLQTVDDVDYWATDAIPEDSRFHWKSFFRCGGQFRAMPLFIYINWILSSAFVSLILLVFVEDQLAPPRPRE
jgi:hypothetical protein